MRRSSIAVGEQAARRRGGRRAGGTVLLPPWTRAPLLSLRQPAVLLAVVGAAAVMACAAASAALFLSSAESESLRVQLAGQCPDAAFPVVQQIGFGVGFTTPRDVSASAPESMRLAGLPPPYQVVQINSPVAIQGGSTSTLGQVFYRDGAAEQLDILSTAPGEGLLLPDSTARSLDVRAGGSVQIGAASFPVAGVYRDLFTAESVPPYWCSYTGLFLNESSGSAPPALIVGTSAQIVERAGEQESPQGMARSWVSPISTERLTLSEASRVVSQRQQAFSESGIANNSGGEGDTGLLPGMVERTELITSGLRGPVLPIAAGGAVLALLLMGAAGSYWADRRASEVRLLSSRGVGPGALGVKAVLELMLPAAVGTVLGWALARGLIGWLGPSPHLDAAAPGQAAVTAAIGLAAGLLLLAAVAGLRARGGTERTIGARRSWTSMLPWELLLLAAAAASYLRLRGGDAVVLDRNVAQVNLLLISFPLLFLAGAAILTVRLLSTLLRPLRAHSQRWRPAMYVAIRRIAGAPLVSAGLLAAVSLPIAVLAYSATLTTTTQVTLEAKARVVTGSDLAAISVDRPTRTPATDAVGTIVARYPYGTADGQDVTVLAIDPATFDRWAFWDDSFAAVPLSRLLDALGTSPSGRVTAIATGLPAGPAVVRLGERDIDIDVAAVADTFPGRRQLAPLVVVDASSLGEVDRSAGRTTEVWSTRSEADVRAALGDGTRVTRVLDRDTVFAVANFLSVSWTFAYLQALAALIAVIALGGLLLFLETRQRARVASYTLARRMGMTAGTHLRSLLAELGGLLGLAFLLGSSLGWLAVLTVYQQVDIDPNRPPPPLLTSPGLTITAAALATVAVAGLAALYAQRAANRADIAEVLRLAD